MKTFDFIKSEPITKGWSKDKKYCVTNRDGTKYLFRISPIEQYEKKKTLFEMLEKVAKLDIPMCRPIEFGVCADGVYLLQTWIEGFDADDTISLLSKEEQYAYGLKAGEILKKIHTIPAPKSQEEWSSRFNKKTDRRIEGYKNSSVKYDGGEKFIEYINANRHLLNDRPQCFQHGDYHIGNMMIEDEQLAIIDFDRFDFGDPWEEFNRIVWCAQVSHLFACGMVNGYFNGKPPLEFWKLLALYIASNTVASISWGNSGQSDLQTMLKQAQSVYVWYEGMETLVPKWYS
jgi:aminoglycoside phosphotransferase (APT) family kinase protein